MTWPASWSVPWSMACLVFFFVDSLTYVRALLLLWLERSSYHHRTFQEIFLQIILSFDLLFRIFFVILWLIFFHFLLESVLDTFWWFQLWLGRNQKKLSSSFRLIFFQNHSILWDSMPIRLYRFCFCPWKGDSTLMLICLPVVFRTLKWVIFWTILGVAFTFGCKNFLTCLFFFLGLPFYFYCFLSLSFLSLRILFFFCCSFIFLLIFLFTALFNFTFIVIFIFTYLFLAIFIFKFFVYQSLFFIFLVIIVFFPFKCFSINFMNLFGFCRFCCFYRTYRLFIFDLSYPFSNQLSLRFIFFCGYIRFIAYFSVWVLVFTLSQYLFFTIFDLWRNL